MDELPFDGAIMHRGQGGKGESRGRRCHSLSPRLALGSDFMQNSVVLLSLLLSLLLSIIIR